jgi:hypothetical protein
MEEREQVEQHIRDLMSLLSSSASPIGDWKIVKCYEAKLQGQEMPYDLNELMAERQRVRDEINELQESCESSIPSNAESNTDA